jgi:hypothetical protein
MYAHSWRLSEASIVPVPSNPNALEGGRAAGIDFEPLRQWAEYVLDVRAAPPGLIADAENAWRGLFARPTFTIDQVRQVVRDEISRPATVQPQAPTVDPARTESNQPAAPAANDVRAIANAVLAKLNEETQ